ncbi:glycosyltransferase family 4 protein [Candidatus Azambacteria bacterium]|nr:glycosyltransferase family 4 protein [Candidatus Azambacteria bacterium]MBI3685233.1 glycosyltransferase family 4 protein [Candidatus Azambacteria bacterium]
MIRVGIECEQLEQNRFGIGHTLAQLLEAMTKVPDVQRHFRFVLYFKEKLPGDAFLDHPVFEKRVLMQGKGLFNLSFNVFYHILLPLRYWMDVIDVFLFPSNMLPAFFVGKAVVVLVNDVYWEAHHGTIPFKHRISYLLFCWWAAKRAHIMTISEFSKKELQRFYGIPDGRIFVNPWSIQESFRALAHTAQYDANMRALKKKFGIENDFIVSVGQAFPRRHVKEAIEAFGRVAAHHPRLQYLVACTDKYDPPVLAASVDKVNGKEGRKAVVLVGYLAREVMPYIMNEAKALVYVSSKEAFGLPPVEAVLCGTPAVIADTPTTREFFGEEGFFVGDPSDPSKIAACLTEVFENEAHSRAIAREQAARLRKFTWQAHIEKLFDVFYNLTGTKHR